MDPLLASLFDLAEISIELQNISRGSLKSPRLVLATLLSVSTDVSCECVEVSYDALSASVAAKVVELLNEREKL